MWSVSFPVRSNSAQAGTERADSGRALAYVREGDALTTFMLSVMGAFAEFEWQREGIALAKARGVCSCGRKPVLTPEQTIALRQRVDGGEK